MGTPLRVPVKNHTIMQFKRVKNYKKMKIISVFWSIYFLGLWSVRGWPNCFRWPFFDQSITLLKNVARGHFPIPAELISSHLQSLVNISPSLARQSHAQRQSDDDEIVMACSDQILYGFFLHIIQAFRTSEKFLNLILELKQKPLKVLHLIHLTSSPSKVSKNTTNKLKKLKDAPTKVLQHKTIIQGVFLNCPPLKS